jgi:hypothetical protein
MTTNLKKYPTRIKVEHNNKKGMIAIDQIRTIDKSRIIKKFDRLSKSEIQKCKDIIQETFENIFECFLYNKTSYEVSVFILKLKMSLFRNKRKFIKLQRKKLRKDTAEIIL